MCNECTDNNVYGLGVSGIFRKIITIDNPEE